MNLEIIKNAKTKILGKHIEYYEEISSTQKKAKENQNKVRLDGNIIIADKQTNGIGTKDHKWHTGNKENIAMTISIYPECDIKCLEGITIEVARCIKKSIQKLYGYQLSIKEPNDLFLNGRKIGGILTQSATFDKKVAYIFIGIGFNVNQVNFTEDINMIATSLKKEYKKNFLREEIIAKILEEMEESDILKKIIF